MKERSAVDVRLSAKRLKGKTTMKWIFAIRMIFTVLALLFLILYAVFGGTLFLVLGYVFFGATVVSVILFWIVKKKTDRAPSASSQSDE